MNPSIRYISVLRGINVSGQKLIKMEQLKEIYVSLNFTDVKTYIQSGNIGFNSSEKSEKKLCKAIFDKLLQTLRYEVPGFIRTTKEIAEIINRNPFHFRMNEKNHQLYITFLNEEPTPEMKQKLESFSRDVETFKIEQREVYSFIDKSFTGKILYSNNYIEKILKMQGTTRNWATVNKLLQL